MILAESEEYDGLILDIMLPGMDGIQVLKQLRKQKITTPDLLSFHDVILNRSTYELIYKEQTRVLSGKEFQILDILMEKPYVIVSTDQLLTHIWGWDSEVDTSVVWVHISNLRKKVSALGAPIEIRFIRNAGNGERFSFRGLVSLL